MRRVLVPILGLAAALAACDVKLPGSGEPPQLYTLTPKSTYSPELPQVDWQLIVETPVAPAGLNTSRIALQRSPISLDYYARSNWTDLAPLLVQTLLIESFENTGKILAVGRESTALRADYVLKTELREFQAEYDGGDAPLIRVRLNGKLVQMPTRTIIANHTAERTVRSEKGDMAGIVQAFDDALGKVMKQLVEWALLVPGERPAARRPARRPVFTRPSAPRPDRKERASHPHLRPTWPARGRLARTCSCDWRGRPAPAAGGGSRCGRAPPASVPFCRPPPRVAPRSRSRATASRWPAEAAFGRSGSAPQSSAEFGLTPIRDDTT
ncbi:MAG: ABC-type transport auxiliary lipoprotein family protein [Pseudomonadota bacterium]